MNALEIKNLTKSYPDFTLDNLNLTLPSGCIMGLVGENGAGKSTTIKLILDMIHKDSGSITILGRDNGDNIKLTKEDIGVVLDEVGIPECLTVNQVGKVMKHTFQNWNDAEYSRLVQKLALPDKKQFKEFSRGMKMKLGIAVAMSHNSKLLILDEATSGLDPVVRDEVVEMFSEFTRDESHSVLISSHIVNDLEKLCDYIAFLHKGKLLLCEEKDLLREEQIVSEKYLIGVLVQLTMLLVTGIAQATKMMIAGDFVLGKLAVLMLLMLVVSMLASSIPLPFIFKLGVEKGRTAYYVMIGFVCSASVLATSFFRSQLGIEIKPNLVLAILAVVGVGTYALSWRMAITFYKKREIQ